MTPRRTLRLVLAVATLGLCAPAGAVAASAPGAPTPVAPRSGADGVAASPALAWSDGGGGTKSYEAEVARGADFIGARVATKTGLTATTWTVSPSLQPGASYAWRVRAKNRQGTSAWSVPQTFTVAQDLAPSSGSYVFIRASSPARTLVTDASGAWLATFTDGARTVTLRGPSRLFGESTATYPVTSEVWVRTLAEPFGGTVDVGWLDRRLADGSADILALAMQYVENAPDVLNTARLRIAGDAHYGPLLSDGSRQEGSDFNDFLGVAWTYATTTDQPEAAQLGSLDCSGFLRMVWGYRTGIPLSLATDAGASLPRRAFQIYDAAPGLVTVPNTGAQVTALGALSPGDLVFFDAATDDGTQIDHAGMYLGIDAGGNRRFISSRKGNDGPTLGDAYGRSVLNGTGLYAKAFRGARRL